MVSRKSSDSLIFRCSACGADKTATEFSYADERLGVLNAYCRICHAEYRRAHYLANKSDYVRRAIAQMKARREVNRRGVLHYLSMHPCVDCGIADPVVLEFDHRDPKHKLTEVSRLIVNKRWTRVLAEIEKCDVRCINCHRRRTARQFHWGKATRQ
jgi:hypothetical protein